MEFSYIDKGIYEAIRLKLVAAGNLPDGTVLSGPAYVSALEALRSSGNLIELFGMANPYIRGNLDTPSILINLNSSGVGTVGSSGSSYLYTYSEDDNEYSKQRCPGTTTTFSYNIRGIAKTTAQQRAINTVIISALEAYSYLSLLNESGTKVGEAALTYNGMSDVYRDNNIFEFLHNYTVHDVWIDTGNAITTVPELTDIDFEILTN